MMMMMMMIIIIIKSLYLKKFDLEMNNIYEHRYKYV